MRLWNTDDSRTIVAIDEAEVDVDDRYRPALELRGDITTTIEALADRLDGLRLPEAGAALVAAQRARLEKGQSLPEHDDSAGLQMTGAPTVHDGKLFVPISSGVDARPRIALRCG